MAPPIPAAPLPSLAPLHFVVNFFVLETAVAKLNTVAWGQGMLRAYLVHGVRQEGSERAPLTGGLLLETVDQRGEGRALHALSQHLHAVVVVADVLLVDAQHGQ